MSWLIINAGEGSDGPIRTLVLTSEIPSPPTPGSPGDWTPTPSAELTATIAAIETGYIHVPQVAGMQEVVGGGVVPSDTDPIGQWSDVLDTATGLTATGAGRPAWNSTEGAVQFAQPSGLGEALFFPEEITANKWHMMLCIKSTDTAKAVSQCVLQIPAMRLLTNDMTTYKLTVQVVSGGVQLYDIAAGTVTDYTLVEMRRDGSTLQVRTNGMNWVSHTVPVWANYQQFGDAVNDPNRSLLGRASYTDATFTDYVSWSGFVNGCVIKLNDWFSDVDAAEARKVACQGQTVASLDPGASPPVPTPGDEPGSNGTATVSVSTYAALASAISAAGPGSIIEAADGTYSGAKLVASNSGTAENPIVIRAANILGANVPGGVSLTGQHIVWRGFDMNNTGTSPNPMVEIGGTDNQVWRCRVRCYRDQVRFLNGSGGRFMYNEMTNPNPSDDFQGDTHLLRGWYNSSTLHYNAEIGFNYIHDFPSKPPGTPYSAYRRFGVAAGSLYTYMFFVQNWYIHHNLMQNCGSHRLACYGSGNLFEYNTVTGVATAGSSVSTDFNQRIGRNNVWRGNWGENLRVGMAVHGGPHQIISQKLVGCNAEIFAGDRTPDELTERYPYAFQVKLTGCDIPNTIVGRSWDSSWPYAATDTRIEDHTGTVTLNGSLQTGTVQTGTPSEMTVTPIKMLASQVGPSGTGV